VLEEALAMCMTIAYRGATFNRISGERSLNRSLRKQPSGRDLLRPRLRPRQRDDNPPRPSRNASARHAKHDGPGWRELNRRELGRERRRPHGSLLFSEVHASTRSTARVWRRGAGRLQSRRSGADCRVAELCNSYPVPVTNIPSGSTV
jgi:hypothetical protein